MIARTPKSLVAGAFLALATATATAAQQTTLSIPFFGYGDMPIDASIVAVQNHVTTMALNCAPGTDSNDCGLAPFQTLIIGPSTYNMNLNGGAEITMTQDCTIHSAQSTAVCAESAGGSGANYPGSSTTTYNGTDYIVMPVTATAGVTALGSNGASATTTTTTTTTASSSSGTSSSTTNAVTSSAPATGQTATSHGASSTSPTASGTGSRTSSASASPSTGAATYTGFNGGSFGVVGALAAAVWAALL